MTITPTDEHVSEAQRLFDSRVSDLRTFSERGESAIEGDDELGSVYDYGLSWEKVTTNHRDDTVTYEHLLSTGGPHDHFEVTYDDRGAVTSWTYVYLPWFDRVEIHSAEVGIPTRDLVATFYETWFAPEV